MEGALLAEAGVRPGDDDRFAGPPHAIGSPGVRASSDAGGGVAAAMNGERVNASQREYEAATIGSSSAQCRTPSWLAPTRP